MAHAVQEPPYRIWEQSLFPKALTMVPIIGEVVAVIVDRSLCMRGDLPGYTQFQNVEVICQRREYATLSFFRHIATACVVALLFDSFLIKCLSGLVSFGFVRYDIHEIDAAAANFRSQLFHIRNEGLPEPA